MNAPLKPPDEVRASTSIVCQLSRSGLHWINADGKCDCGYVSVFDRSPKPKKISQKGQ